MTKAQRKAHKRGNQRRKHNILIWRDRHGKRNLAFHLGGVIQNGKYSRVTTGGTP